MLRFKAFVKSRTYTEGGCAKTTKPFAISRKGTTTTSVNKTIDVNYEFVVNLGNWDCRF